MALQAMAEGGNELFTVLDGRGLLEVCRHMVSISAYLAPPISKTFRP